MADARKLPVSWPNLPFQGRTLRTVDPVGMPLDLYFRMDRVPSMLQKYAAYKGARIQRIDHINCFTPDVQASYDFYTELGFRLTETTETEGADPKLWAVWMQRRGRRTISPSPTARARACITSACGTRTRSTSCTPAT